MALDAVIINHISTSLKSCLSICVLMHFLGPNIYNYLKNCL